MRNALRTVQLHKEKNNKNMDIIEGKIGKREQRAYKKIIVGNVPNRKKKLPMKIQETNRIQDYLNKKPMPLGKVVKLKSLKQRMLEVVRKKKGDFKRPSSNFSAKNSIE